MKSVFIVISVGLVFPAIFRFITMEAVRSQACIYDFERNNLPKKN